jgi:hypothetical protein
MAISANNTPLREIGIKFFLFLLFAMWFYFGIVSPIMKFSSKDKNVSKVGAGFQLVCIGIAPMAIGGYVYSQMNSY